MSSCVIDYSIGSNENKQDNCFLCFSLSRDRSFSIFLSRSPILPLCGKRAHSCTHTGMRKTLAYNRHNCVNHSVSFVRNLLRERTRKTMCRCENSSADSSGVLAKNTVRLWRNKGQLSSCLTIRDY